jgi:5,10-methylenetetrahydromethanopterin reductase
MEFGIGFGQDITANEVPEYIGLAEEAGFHHATFVDLGSLSRETHVMMTLAAVHSERIKIGHGVVDPIMYHPQVIANAGATLREVTRDRAFVGLGTGGPSGKPSFRTARIDLMREAMRFIRSYTAGEDATFGEATWSSEWMRNDSEYAGQPVPIWLAICGPRTSLLGGECADAVWSIGIDATLQRWRKELVDRGAEEAGRDPSEIDLWVRTQVYVAESKEEAFEELAAYAAASAFEVARFCRRKNPETEDMIARLERAHPGLLDEFQQIYDLWDPYSIEQRGGPQTEAVTQRCIDFFLASGTPEQIREQLEPLRELGVKGISNVTHALYDIRTMMAVIADELIGTV